MRHTTYPVVGLIPSGIHLYRAWKANDREFCQRKSVGDQMILDKIVEDKKIRLPQVKQQIAISEQRRMAVEDVLKQQQGNSDAWKSRSFLEALKKPGISIIGEFKKASPSLGIIKDQIPLTDRME